MKKIKFLFLNLFLLIFLFVGLPGKINSGDALKLDSPETGPSLPAPYHPNDILTKPPGLRETEIFSEYGSNKLMIYYVVPTDVPIDLDVRTQLREASRDMQAWYQTATGGWTWDFASTDVVEIYEAQESSQYYHDHDNWWGSLLPEMQASGLPIWSPGVVTTIWVQGAGWWAGGKPGCEGNCGVALLGVELFPQFNDPKFSGDTCPDPDGEGSEAWPCTPVGAFAHELGHTLGLIHPIDDPDTAPYAVHSIMQTHWNYPDEAPGEAQPWGFLRTERLRLQASSFMKLGIQLRQVYQDRESAVNLPPDGDSPLIKFDTVVTGGRLKTINNTEDALNFFWTFGDYQTSHENAPVHWYLETGSYNVILRASDSSGMMVTSRTNVNVLSLDQNEPNDSLEQAYDMLYGESIVAAIDTHDTVPFYDDKDYFRFFGFKDEAIAARANANYSGSNLWPILCLVDDAGVDLACHSGQNVGELFYTLPETGTYYLKVDAICGEGGIGCQGPYALTVGADYEHEPNNTIQEATAILCDDTIQATLNGYDGVIFWEDRDFYHFSCHADSLVHIKVDAAPHPDSNLIPFICLYDELGTRINCGDYGNLSSQIEHNALGDKEYIISIEAPCSEGGIDCLGPYTLRLTQELKQMSVFLPIIISIS